MNLKIYYFIILLAMPDFVFAANSLTQGKEALKNGNFVEARVFFENATEEGNSEGQYYLSEFYRRGITVKRDYEKAFSLLLQAGNAGHLEAQNKLGQAYWRGQGVEKDLDSAFSWFQKAADSGFALGQYHLAYMYKIGVGRPKDAQKAFEWYKKAAEQGHGSSQLSVAEAYRNGEGVPVDYDKAVYWYKEAIKLGDVTSNYLLGEMYEKGLGMPKNIDMAMSIYARSNKASSAIRLKEYVADFCKRSDITTLFNTCLKWSKRSDLRNAIKRSGAKIKNEEPNTWSDIYSTEHVLEGSSTLEVTYILSDIFAKAQYTFPSKIAPQQINLVRDFVVDKYGEPDSYTGKVSVGPVSYKWVLPDGIELSVTRDWPDTTSYLTFINLSNHSVLLEQLREQKKAKLREKYKQQSNAF